MSSLEGAEGLARPAMSRVGPRVRVATRTRRSARLGWWLALAVGLGWSLWGAGVGRHALANPAGFTLVRRFLAGALHPDLALGYLRTTASATLVTLAYAVLGAALSVALGLAGGFVVSQTWWRRQRARGHRRAGAAWLGARGLLALPRGLHEAVWGLLLVNILGPDPLVGVLAIGLPYGAVTAKVYADLIDEARPEPYAALLAAGAGRRKAFAYAMFPQTFADMFSYGFYRFDCSIRSAVILGIIGAGGLGFQLDAAFQALNYGQLWTAIYALIVVCGLADLASHRLRRRLGAPRALSCWRDVAGMGRRAAASRDRVLGAAAVVGIAAMGWAWWYLALHPSHLWSARAREQAAYVFGHAWPPAHSGAFLSTLWRASLQTLQMSILAMVLATGAAMLLAPLAARPGRDAGGLERLRSATCRAGLLLARAIPAPVWAFVLLFVLLPGPLPGAVALAAYNLGVLGRLMGEVVENLEPHPQRGLLAQGSSRIQAFAYGVAPRAVPKFLAYGLYRWEVAVRETVVVGLVGAGGLGVLLARQVAGFDWRGGLGTVIALVALTIFVDLVSAFARKAVR